MTIPFEIPKEFIPKVASGEVVRFGALLKDASTGQTVKHLQEASGLVGKLSGGLNPIVQASQLASSVAANVQLEQVKKMLGTLQLMTGATLAVSAIGLGVSVAGFVVMSRKLDRLGSQVTRMEEGLSEVRDRLYSMDLSQRARDRAAIRSAMERGDEAWRRSDRVDVWKDLEGRLSLEENYYRALLETERSRGDSIINDGIVALEDAIAGHEALTQLITARIKCLLLLNELEAAHGYAQGWDKWLRRNYGALTPSSIVDNRMRSQRVSIAKDPDHLRLEMLPRAQEFLHVIREQQEFASSMPDLLNTLITRNINGRDYVEELRARDEDLLLLAPGP